MDEKITSQNWLQNIGKERIQAFQDTFATTFSISLCLQDLEGQAITVWSNYSLFCHYIMQKNKERCLKEEQRVREHVLKSGKPYIFTCYMGLSNFISPLYQKDQIVAVAYGGSVFIKEQISRGKNQYNVPIMSENQIKNILNLLDSCFILFSSAPNEAKEAKPATANTVQLAFLQKKLSIREIEIIQLINKGCSNKEIAILLHISDKTVKTHISNILKKLEMKDRMQIVLFCKQNNFC